jgi:uncharacterized protein (TIGR00106 family)
MILAEFSMFPTDKGESKSKFVSQVLDYIDKSGITYQLTPMGTILEGSWDEVMDVIDSCYKLLEPQSSRIFTTIKIDARSGNESRMKSKISKIESLLHKEISK